MTPYELHCLAIVAVIVIGQIGSGISLGIAGRGAQKAIVRQPIAYAACMQNQLIGLALIESSAIITLVVSLISLFSAPPTTMDQGWIELGGNIGIGLAALFVSIASSSVATAAQQAIARQPFFAAKISTLALVAQSIIEAPAIFAFIIGLTLKTRPLDLVTPGMGLAYAASGLVVGIACIGPCIGQMLFTAQAIQAVGDNKNAYGPLFPITIVTQALLETPIVFALVCAMLVIFGKPTAESLTTIVPRVISALSCICVSSLGAGFAFGYAGSRVCKSIAYDPAIADKIMRMMVLIAVFIESCVIYGFIIALSLIIGV